KIVQPVSIEVVFMFDNLDCRLTHKFAKTGRYVSIHQFGEDMRQQKRTLIIVLLHPFHVGIYTAPCSTRCDRVYEDSFLKTFLLKGRNDGRSNEAQQCACRTTLT